MLHDLYRRCKGVPGCTGGSNGQPTPIKCFQFGYPVVLLMLANRTGSIGNWVDSTVILHLGEHSTQTDSAGISLQDESISRTKLWVG